MIMNLFKWNIEFDSIFVDYQEDVISIVFFIGWKNGFFYIVNMK